MSLYRPLLCFLLFVLFCVMGWVSAVGAVELQTPVKIGDSEQAVIQALGEPAASELSHFEDYWTFKYPQHGMSLDLDEGGVFTIHLFNPGDGSPYYIGKILDGIDMNTKRDEVHKKLGTPPYAPDDANPDAMFLSYVWQFPGMTMSTQFKRADGSLYGVTIAYSEAS